MFDYEPVNSLLIAKPSAPNLVQCVPFQINDDPFPENHFEGLTLTLSLVAPCPRNVIVDGTRESTIKDNDRECAVNVYMDKIKLSGLVKQIYHVSLYVLIEIPEY